MAGQPRSKGIAVRLFQENTHRSADVCLNDGDRMVAAKEAEVFVGNVFSDAADDAQRIGIGQRSIGIHPKLCFNIGPVIIYGIRIVFENLTLGIVAHKGIHGADKVIDLSCFKLAQRLRLPALGLAERSVGIVCAKLRPMVIRAEVDVFIRMRGKLGIGIHRFHRASHFPVAEVYHVLLRIGSGVVFLRRIEFAGIRNDHAVGLYTAAESVGDVRDRIRVILKEIIVRIGQIDGPVPDQQRFPEIFNIRIRLFRVIRILGGRLGRFRRRRRLRGLRRFARVARL